MTANNSLFNSAAGIETTTTPAAPSIFDSTGGIFSAGGGGGQGNIIPFGLMYIPQ